MDFITNLPPSATKTVIWVVVDRLTKYAHFVALPTHFTAAQLASVSDRDKLISERERERELGAISERKKKVGSVFNLMHIQSI